MSAGDWFILHLSDLVRVAFMAATSDSDPLRLAGLDTLHQLIDLFSAAPDPEVPGHLLLEQVSHTPGNPGPNQTRSQRINDRPWIISIDLIWLSTYARLPHLKMS